MRRQDARLHPLLELQDRVHIHTGREEAPAAKRVRNMLTGKEPPVADRGSAKYIEGLENRLARMESLMRLSGVLPDDDDGSTDLATLEKRLADRARQSGTPKAPSPDQRRASSVHPSVEQLEATPASQAGLPSPRSGTASPEPQRPNGAKSEKDEDALAEMMCSLVTNNCGETRYIGKFLAKAPAKYNANSGRIIIGVFHLFSKGNTMGQRQDRRRLVPEHDINGRN